MTQTDKIKNNVNIKKCYRCGEYFILTPGVNQSFCGECRGLTGAIKTTNWREQMHGVHKLDILPDLKR